MSRNGNFVRRCPPTFLRIGSIRCGSTCPYQVLKSHPDIKLSDRKQRCFLFFPEMQRHDLDWYEADFESKDGLGPRPVRGEISPVYARLNAWQVNRNSELAAGPAHYFNTAPPDRARVVSSASRTWILGGRDVGKISSIDFLRQVERARNKLYSDYCRIIQIRSKAFRRDALHIDFFDRIRDDPRLSSTAFYGISERQLLGLSR